jgi:hypothetical protein
VSIVIRAIEFLFGCQHRNLTWPQTDRLTGKVTVSCNSCGTRFLYSWPDMKIGQTVNPTIRPIVARPILDKEQQTYENPIA